MKKYISISILVLQFYCCRAQDSVYERYNNTLGDINKLVKRSSVGDFREAVFLVEKTYSPSSVSESTFDRPILILSTIIKQWINANASAAYSYSDSLNVLRNYSIFKILKDTMKLKLPNGDIYKTQPFIYDFEDFEGRQNWTNMSVTKLLATHSGNCHNLPYLYKILADQIRATCWLALAPNHIYISNRCKRFGWYNTELTSGQFPIDAWIMASGYLPLQAIQSGIYMDTLSNQQSIALCILDLAKGYEHKTHNYYDGFILKCCDLSLGYFPLNVQAILLKAETLKRIYEKEKVQKSVTAKETYHQMEQLYVKLFDLGYREMPDKMYQQWLLSVVKEKAKYSNKKLTEAIKVN